MSFKQRNRSIPTPQPAWNFKLLMIAILFFLLIGGKTFGASPFTDDFEGYSLGDLSGQGGWATSTPYYSWQVSTTTTEVGEQAIDCYYGYCGNTKTGTSVEIGKWVFWTYASENFGFGFWIKEGTSDICRVDVSSGGTIKYIDDTGWVDTGWPVIYNNYSPLEIWWNATTDQCKIAYNFNITDWYYSADTFLSIDRLDIFATETPNGNRFIDNISDTLDLPCDDEHCGYCEIYSTCISAGCSWDYSIYLQDYYCYDVSEPVDDECGAFYKCQYCGDQTTCEAELNCQWTDIGFGNQCYMIEPTIPPGQVDWEIPELDECSGSATEIILCEIKNLITGAVMPSQEKIESLYQTIGAFKQKFPFNYIAGLNSFFGNVSNGLEDTKTIPISILGTTSTVNFMFWNSTTTIGGEEETFKNILFDFSTFIILMGWFVWLISLIKRFF